ncbi:MAG: class I SAM-dependent methyltransferase [Verrucomicrobia bacterium]|nr:class I SAM-dependent methyltransferase [Verrucomicrobiota bacterium]
MNSNRQVFLQLIDLYERHGYSIATGLNPTLFSNWPIPSFTAVYKKGETVRTGGGIAPVEVFFIEALMQERAFKKVFIIGNAFGWSTFAFALADRNAQVLALDAGIEGEDNLLGIELTNRIAEAEQLNVKCILGFSPQDVAATVKEHLDGAPDLVFIDGLHTEEQVKKDFEACRAVSSTNTVYLFHDIIISGTMEKAFLDICDMAPDHVSHVLWRTTSGMTMLVPRELNKELAPVISGYSEAEDYVNRVKKTARYRVYLDRITTLRAVNFVKSLIPIPRRWKKWYDV